MICLFHSDGHGLGSNPEEFFRGRTDYPIDLSLWMQTDERGYAKDIGKNGNFGGIGKNSRNETAYDNAGMPVRELRVYRKALADGSAAYGFFNLSETPQHYEFPLDRVWNVRNLSVCRASGKTDRPVMLLPRHGARILKIG